LAGQAGPGLALMTKVQDLSGFKISLLISIIKGNIGLVLGDESI
jgi:hypothetical protein